MSSKFFETVQGTTLKIGEGCTNDLPNEIKLNSFQNVLILTDPNVSKYEPFSLLLQNFQTNKIKFTLFDKIKIEPSIDSISEAIDFARKAGTFDLVVAYGGGSVIDTAKLVAINLSNREAQIDTFIAKPFGKQEWPNHSTVPVFAVPTTSGTGTESSCVAVFHEEKARTKGFARGRYLRPQMAFIDPLNVMTMPRDVTVFSGLDMLIHALESMTAKSCAEVNVWDPKPTQIADKPIFQGTNPMGDVWLKEALKLINANFYKSVNDPTDLNARAQMQLATAYIGYGTGNVGVHLPHGLSYPISGRVHSYSSPDYPSSPGLVPHGLAVSMTASACFKFTGPAEPQRHLAAAEVLGIETKGYENEGGLLLANYVTGVMKDLKLPNGLKALGVHVEDIPDLVDGCDHFLKHLRICPRKPTAEQITEIYQSSMSIY